MRKSIHVAALLLALAATPAQAAVTCHLAWGDTPSKGGALELAYDCASPASASTLVVSIRPDTPLTGVVGVLVEWRAQQRIPGSCDFIGCPVGPIPAFWRFTDGCRPGGVTVSADFTGAPYAGASGVSDPWHGAAIHLAQLWTVREDLLMATSYDAVVPASGPVDLAGGTEYYIDALTFAPPSVQVLHACEGCCLPMWFTATVTITTATGSELASSGTDGETTWQGWSHACAQVPARTRTWGALKGAYR